VESTSGVTEAYNQRCTPILVRLLTLLSSAESSEVLGSLGDNIIVKLELDSASGGVCLLVDVPVPAGRAISNYSLLMAISK